MTGSRPVEAALALTDAWDVGFVATAAVDRTGILAVQGDQSHRVRVASISKVLVGYAAMIAVEEGTLDLDRPIETVDGAPIPLGLTVRHLLAHAGGYGFETPEPLSAPGLRRMYSNTGFELLGAVLAKSSEMSVADYLGEAVLGPLAMANTALEGSPAKDVWSTTADLTTFCGELLAPTLIAPESFADFVAPQWPALAGVVPGLGSFRPCPWGLGVEVRGHKAPHWTGTNNSPDTFGHFGGSGTFLWVDPLAPGGPLALVCLTDREFGPWSLLAWPALSDAVLSAAANR